MTPPVHSPDPRAAAAYWNQILDPRNLAHAPAAETPRAIQRDIALARTPDFLAALRHLAPTLSRPPGVIDLGAGLGNHALAAARMGHRVLALDASLDRMRRLRIRAARVGVQLPAVVARAEALPFRTGSVGALYTKSVLIHTDLDRALDEIARILGPGGRCALIEPQPGNPFVRLYRATLAPSAWKSITRYFDAPRQRLVAQRIGPTRLRPFYFLGFLGFIFEFGVPWPKVRNGVLACLRPVDALLFSLIPPLRWWAWFGLLEAEKPAAKPSAEADSDGDLSSTD